MPDLSEFVQASTRRGGCAVSALLGRLDEGQREKVIAALDEPHEAINSVAIVRVVKAWGVEETPSSNTISTHRRGGCSCPRPNEGSVA